MSLYSYEEVCTGCRFAVFHNCVECVQGKMFCHCGEGHHEIIDHSDGTCKYYSAYKRRTPDGLKKGQNMKYQSNAEWSNNFPKTTDTHHTKEQAQEICDILSGNYIYITPCPYKGSVH